MESDDQNFHNTKQTNIDASLLVNSKYSCDESMRIDKNGNVCDDNLNDNCHDIDKDEKSKSAELKAVSRLQALAMSDDEDYGEYF